MTKQNTWGRLFNRFLKGLFITLSVVMVNSTFANQVFFASDLPESVRSGISKAFLIADNKWGDYLSRPIEYWVLGADIEAANDLADVFCVRRLANDDELLGMSSSQLEISCNEIMMYPNHRSDINTLPAWFYEDADRKGDFEFYRVIGANAIQNNELQTDMGLNGGSQWGVSYIVSSFPLRLCNLDDPCAKDFGVSYAPWFEQKTVFHEAFHGVQYSLTSPERTDPAVKIEGGLWFVEGGAEYMAYRTLFQSYSSGELDMVGDNIPTFQAALADVMRGVQSVRPNCPIRLLPDLNYEDNCGATYEMGAWGIAYFLHKAGNQNALLEIFYPKLASLGWEGAFEATIGMSTDTFYAEFDTFLNLPLDDQLAILPIISRPKAEAGSNQTVRRESLVTLDGSDSESADFGAGLTYSWSFISQPSGSTATISNPTNVIASFTADIVGAYTVQLVVSDQEQSSFADTVTFIAVDSVIPRAQVTDSLRIILAGEYNRPSEDAESWAVWSTDTPQAYKDRYFSTINAVTGTLGNYKNWTLLAVNPDANDTVNATVIQRFKELHPWFVEHEEYFGPVTTETVVANAGCLNGSFIEKFDSDGILDASTSEFHSICHLDSAVETWFPEELDEKKYEADYQLRIALGIFHEYFHHYQRAHGLTDMRDWDYDFTEAPRWWIEGIASGASVYWWLRSNYMKLDFVTDQARAKVVIKAEIDELNTESFWWYSQRIQNSGTLVDRGGNPLDMSEALDGSDCSGWLLDENTDMDAPVPNCDRMAVAIVPQFMAHKSSWQAVLRDMPADMHEYGFWGAVEIHTGLNEQQFYDEFNALMRSQDWRSIGINDSPEGWNIPAESIEETVDFLNIDYSTVEDLPVDNDGDGVPDPIDNCPNTENLDQLDTDGNSKGNACDTDDDNDGIPDASDALPLDVTESVDTDSDGIGNNADTDDDGDGLTDTQEAIDGTNPLLSDTDGDGFSDGDEVLAGTDPLVPNVKIAKADFNGDGNADILWRNQLTGQNWLWTMNGLTLSKSQGLRSVNTDWNIVGQGDFNGDDKYDILWRNSRTGLNYIWMMDGFAFSERKAINTVADLDWQIKAVADFNGDVKSDILWHHQQTGQTYIYLMDGFQILARSSVRYVDDVNWQIQAAADVNGDGKSDVIWRHQRTGANYIWLMDGYTLEKGYALNTVPNEWDIVGAGDLNGDGHGDIVWRNPVDGRNWAYLMKDGQIETRQQINTVDDAEWQIKYIADFDGDGNADIFWHNQSTGLTYVYLMDGAAITSRGALNVVSPDWQVIGK